MKAALARVFKTTSSRYQIDQNSGSIFTDGQHTRGHHKVKVTDTLTGTVYYCDFHSNGTYYTRSNY